MRIEIADPKQVIYIGQRGENEATQVVFQKSYFAGFDGGTYELLAQRKGDADPYPVTITEDADNVYWTVSDTDCGVEGNGQCELSLVNGTQIVKSLVYVTRTGASLGAEEPLPTPSLSPTFWDDLRNCFTKWDGETGITVNVARATGYFDGKHLLYINLALQFTGAVLTPPSQGTYFHIIYFNENTPSKLMDLLKRATGNTATKHSLDNVTLLTTGVTTEQLSYASRLTWYPSNEYPYSTVGVAFQRMDNAASRYTSFVVYIP